MANSNTTSISVGLAGKPAKPVKANSENIVINANSSVYSISSEKAREHLMKLDHTYQLKLYKSGNKKLMPFYATFQSACFDISADIDENTVVKGFAANNSEIQRRSVATTVDSSTVHSITIMPGERLMIPTGIFLDIPEGAQVKVYARSGLSLKKGLTLVNSVGIIDSDYVDEVFVLLTNISSNRAVIKSGDRIAQGELCPTYRVDFVPLHDRPQRKANRTGGFGSTGEKVK